MKQAITLCTLLFVFSCTSQGKRALLGETAYQQKLNASYKDASKSPLKKKDLKNFKGLDFFPVDSSFIVRAKLVRTQNPPLLKWQLPPTESPSIKNTGS